MSRMPTLSREKRSSASGATTRCQGSMRLGGVDGTICVDDGGRAAVMEMQLNRNARLVECRTSADTEVVCYKVPELRIIEGKGDQGGEKMGPQPVCRVTGTTGRDKIDGDQPLVAGIFHEKEDS